MNLACDANITNSKVQIKRGRKYIKVDVGPSGKYMIDDAGDIYGTKAYGVIHKGYRFGNLNTINDWHWGGCWAGRKIQQ